MAERPSSRDYGLMSRHSPGTLTRIYLHGLIACLAFAAIAYLVSQLSPVFDFTGNPALAVGIRTRLGYIRLVPMDDIKVTNWTLEQWQLHQFTFGSVIPEDPHQDQWQGRVDRTGQCGRGCRRGWPWDNNL